MPDGKSSVGKTKARTRDGNSWGERKNYIEKVIFEQI